MSEQSRCALFLLEAARPGLTYKDDGLDLSAVGLNSEDVRVSVLSEGGRLVLGMSSKVQLGYSNVVQCVTR